MAMHPALQQPAAAPNQPRPFTSGRDAHVELQIKEQEVSQLRVAALRALEQQVRKAQLHPAVHAIGYGSMNR